MSINNETIKKELVSLFRKHNPNSNITTDVDNCMRKLGGFVPNDIPQLLLIEDDILNKVKCGSSDTRVVIEAQNYIRQIKNMSIRDPGKLLFFLKELSPLGNNAGNSNVFHMKSFLAATTSMENIRTSTPLRKSANTFNRLHLNDNISLRVSNRPIKPVPLMDHNFTKSTSLQNISEGNRNNSAIQPKPSKSSHNYQISNELSEYTIIGDILYVIIGSKGQYIWWNSTLVRLEVAEGVVLSSSQLCLISKLCKIGLAYTKIQEYIERSYQNKSSGTVCQYFSSALREHLASYDHLVDMLHRQYNEWTAEMKVKESADNCENRLTIHRLVLWLHDPTDTLFFILAIVDNVSGQKGGELASSLYKYLLNGDSSKQKLVRHLLLNGVDPIFQFIDKWIYDGVLDECHQEFFVAVNLKFDFNSTWTEKYAIRSSMIPSFITTADAEKILLAGKSINFLREICEEKAVFKNRREFFRLKQVTAESMINPDIDRSFSNMITTVYKETSKDLLEVMFTKYKLMDHLKAFRNYMLQGQGDFILRLIELIGPELSKSGGDLFARNMNGPLDEALRSTNAQYDSRDILDRIDIKLLKVTEDENGWDIFTLNYFISDLRPLLTIVNKDSLGCYLRTFTFLFRSRRVHYILNSFFKKRNSSHRAFASLPKEVKTLLHFSQVIIMEMLHFVNQIQYYINIEVLESSWKKFTESVGRASDLNDVLKYHQAFLKQITHRCLLEPESRGLLTNLRSIYDLIITFEVTLDKMFDAFQTELRHRAAFDDTLTKLRSQGQWAVNNDAEKREKCRQVTFTERDVRDYHFKLHSHRKQYDSQLIKFASTLIDHEDASLRSLYTHIDYNNRYKDRIRDYRRGSRTHDQ